jgi:hypothetical protein
MKSFDCDLVVESKHRDEALPADCPAGGKRPEGYRVKLRRAGGWASVGGSYDWMDCHDLSDAIQFQ